MVGSFIVTLFALQGQLTASQELQALAKADQRDRQFTGIPDLNVIRRLEKADFAREERVRQLLREDKVLTGPDLDAASLIFQHGSDPDDYLTARELSILAYTKGCRSTLQTAAEDRFLLSIGQRQRFGNQFRFDSSGNPVFQELDEEPPTAVSDSFRAEFMLAPMSQIRAKGLQAFGEAIGGLAERLKGRTAASWIARQDARRESRDLERLAKTYGGKDYDVRAVSRVLALYRSDALGSPANFRNAAVVLATSSEATTVLLGNELAALAASRGDASARKIFAQTLDKFLVILGRPDRYGTQSGAPRVSPVVAREFGLRQTDPALS